MLITNDNKTHFTLNCCFYQSLSGSYQPASLLSFPRLTGATAHVHYIFATYVM